MTAVGPQAGGGTGAAIVRRYVAHAPVPERTVTPVMFTVRLPSSVNRCARLHEGIEEHGIRIVLHVAHLLPHAIHHVLGDASGLHQ